MSPRIFTTAHGARGLEARLTEGGEILVASFQQAVMSGRADIENKKGTKSIL